MRRIRPIQGTAEKEAEFSKAKMAHDNADSVDGIIIAFDDPTPKRGASDHHELKTTKLKKKKAKRVRKPFPIPDLIVPVGRRRKRAVEGTTEEAAFRAIKRENNDAEGVDRVILTSDDPPSKRRASDCHELKTSKLKESKATGVQKDLSDPQCNNELVNNEKPVLGSISSTACHLAEVLCAVTGNPSQKNVVSMILVSFLENILKLNQSEASSSTHLDNVLSEASQVLIKNVIVLVQFLQMNLKEETEKLKDENEKLKDETKNLKDEKKNLQRGIEAVLSVIHLK